jgi:CTP synthase (UTP-ammonia lyase)
MPRRRVGVLIDLPPNHVYHVATLAALEHAAAALGRAFDIEVLTTDRLDGHAALPHDAVVIGPGSPYRNEHGVLEVIRSARERGVPLVGT